MAASLVDSFVPQVSGGVGVQHWSEAVAGGTIHTMVSIGPNGIPAGVSSVMVPSGVSAMASQTDVNTVGAATLTAAQMLTTNILRGGTQTGIFTDTTDTAAAIQSAWAGAGQSSSFAFTYQNNTAYQVTLAGGASVSITGNTIIPQNTWARYIVIWTGAGTIGMYFIEAGQLAPLPYSQVTSNSVTSGTIASGTLTGAEFAVWIQAGATPGVQTTRTAAQLIADTPNGAPGMSNMARIINTSGNGTLTLSGGSGVTVSGTNTISGSDWRDFSIVFNGGTQVTITEVGGGTLP